MKLKSNSQIFGSYELAFFIIRLAFNINDETKIINDTPEELGTLIHEYIHYLQDISTTYGMFSISFMLAKLRGYIAKVGNTDSNQVSSPISLSDLGDFEELDAIINCSEGDYEDWTYEKYKDVEIEEYRFQPDDIIEECFNIQVGVPRIKLKLTGYDNVITKKEFTLGALAIRESMASLIERHLYPQDADGYRVQYDIVELLCEYVYPEFAARKEYVVTLCDVAMMFDHPAEYLVVLLRYFKKFKIMPQNINEIYDIASKIIKFSDGKDEYSYLKKYINEFKKCIDEVNIIIPKENPHYDDLNSGVRAILTNAINIRSKRISFITEVMMLDQNKGKEHIGILMSRVLPILHLVDLKKDTYGYFTDKEGKASSIMFSALYAVYKIFLINGGVVCDMKDICSMQCKDLVDRRCYGEPWSKASDEKLCPFALIWSMWKLDGKKIISLYD